ncbi:helicase HerA-like domain-containing protein [Rhizobium nepotum]|uniref:helicase HerA-like domain-containing protein n=1 Tax=Rhizobium nepotum TaxID=1035271 RepID=UPI003CF62A9E
MTIAALNSKHGIPLAKANRHGLITGQTGTGKTVTLQTLVEQFSKAGVPVFVSDVKGDIAALSRSCPTQFLDVFGETGKPLIVSISAMGPELMSRAMELTDTQAGVLEIAFAVSRDKEWPLDTISNLRATLALCIRYQDEISARYGQISKASVGVIMRGLLRIEQQGGNRFFGNRQFDVAALLDMAQKPRLSHDVNNRFEYTQADEFAGAVSILQAERLINSPRVYAAFLLWLLTELWDRLPEIGDRDKPRLVLFFDEAHLLFSEINPSLLRRIEQTVRLIRSKGVGVYFVTQSPDDVPAAIREQLAFRIEHSRANRIGHARFTGIDANGRPFDAGVVPVDLPECPLGALADDEKPVAATVEPMAESPQWARLGKPEIALLLAILIAGGFVFYGIVWLWFAGTMGKAAALGFAVAVAGFMRG